MPAMPFIAAACVPKKVPWISWGITLETRFVHGFAAIPAPNPCQISRRNVRIRIVPLAAPGIASATMARPRNGRRSWIVSVRVRGL